MNDVALYVHVATAYKLINGWVGGRTGLMYQRFEVEMESWGHSV